MSDVERRRRRGRPKVRWKNKVREDLEEGKMGREVTVGCSCVVLERRT